MQENDNDATGTGVSTNSVENNRNFICGVIEGFYGRPWTTEQRKDLFRKLKKWGMDSYVYAPKDDYKHRAFWRELYTVEEAEFLSSLIAMAKEHGVTFYYALSPGLDMQYSNQKEIQILKRKLDQVSQFGCVAFALLFDDIESELCKADKEVYQTFANAQVSVTNEIYTHLQNPRFLFCPTQYCSSRAVPTIQSSEYLNTLGSKLNQGIDIMWTGNKVISKTITLESIQVITEILRRPPVIWDNLHANDYDQKRVFLGPYCGRSPELIPHLRGVMTNPNCEFHANTISIHTLAYWSKCSLDSKMNSSISADIKLETENEDGVSSDELADDVCLSSKKIYHPRIALKNAIAEWLPEFFVEKEAWGPITKPQPQVTMVMPIIPILPSINTCMSLTTTTTTSTNSKSVIVPEVNTTQLQALADVCSTVNSSSVNPISNPIMNSLISPTKVVTNDDIVNPIPTTVASNIELPKKIPLSIVPVPIMHPKTASDVAGDNSSSHSEKFDEVSKSSGTAETDLHTENFTHNKNDINEKNSTDETKEEDGHHPSNNRTSTSIDEDVVIDEKLNEPAIGVLSVDTVAMFMLDESNTSPLSAAGNEPMECSSSLTSQTSPKGDRKAASEDIVMTEETTTTNEVNSCMQVESSPTSLSIAEEMKENDSTDSKSANDHDGRINPEDLYLLCDLFYLPFEHGSRGCKLLSDFNWLKANASVLLSESGGGSGGHSHNGDAEKNDIPQQHPEVAEWLQRAEQFSNLCNSVHELLKKMANCANKEICHDLFSYIWDITGTLTLLNAFIKWLSLGRFPPNVYTFTQGTFTWFSKGWKEAFMSGDQEPWVFRGGLTADLQRLMPVDSGNDLYIYKLPEMPTTDCCILRPYTPIDEAELNAVCTHTYIQQLAGNNISLPENVSDLIADNVIGPYVTFNPHLCIVAHDAANKIVGYVVSALDTTEFSRNIEVCWMPTMCEKYPLSLTENPLQFSACERLNNGLCDMVKAFHNYKYDCPTEVCNNYPAMLISAVLNDTLSRDHGIDKRLVMVALATLRANGCFGVHIRLSETETEQIQYYNKVGFIEVYRDELSKYVYLGRRF